MNLLFKALLILAFFTACKNQSTQNQTPANDGSAILKHKYWVAKQFNDVFFASNIIDTLSYIPCSELIFINKDTVLMTACLSDAGMGVVKFTSANTFEVAFEGFEGKPSVAHLDEKTGILHVDSPADVETGWPTEFVAQDDIDVSNLDNATVNLGRKRLAGSYRILPKKGEMAITSMVELHPDGSQVGFGDFDTYEPWPSGIGGSFIQNPPRNLMYFVKKGKEAEPTAVAWQVHGDTMRIWDTKNVGAEGDLPEYKVTQLRGTYVKAQ